ncbi:MAG: type I glyceraldehyde-3-phosphate dehydrogenase [Acidobacteriota bacterium]|nr:type I glyceraldehyde-3-phosphate dehydrogenase [Acidobacteriota bacterium]MDH3523114.1 type I glyceraldehyde-3-phosphate dehydrogenase [Acidobacteriota bacterium]
MRIGLMGIGRIGRNLFRILYKNRDIEIVAIDEIADHATIEYLIRFDTILGPFPDELSIRDGHLYVAGRRIPMTSFGAPSNAPWADLGVDLVVEAAGRERTREELEQHLERGARRVILCAPPKDPPDLTVVMGVNDDQLGPQHRIISNASCTAHCAAPIVKILSDAFGIERAFLSTVHAYTNQQRLADVPSEDPRRGRAAAENIIPQATNAAHVVEELLPELAGRISGGAINVPVANGSVVDLVCWHEQPVTQFAVNEVVRTAASSDWQGILHYEDDPIVSSDIVRSSYSSTFDSQATMILGDRVSKTLSWYDNGWGYAHRVVDLIRRFIAIEEREAA